MPRDSQGNYSLPAGNPVVSGTTIEADGWANPTMNDVAAEMTQSLDRSGRGAMTGALRIPDGSSGVPSLAFASEPQTGRFRSGTAAFEEVIQGLAIAKMGSLRQAFSRPAYFYSNGAVFDVADYTQHLRLNRVSSTQLSLDPHNGKSVVLWDNTLAYWRQFEFPWAGLTYTTSGSDADNTWYGVYLRLTSNNPPSFAIDLSTTKPSRDSSGYYIRTVSTAPRLYVGCVYKQGGQFVNDPNYRYVRSWFNQIPITMRGDVITESGFSSSSRVEIGSEANRLNYISHGITGGTNNDEAVNAQVTGTWASSQANERIGVTLDWFDATTPTRGPDCTAHLRGGGYQSSFSAIMDSRDVDNNQMSFRLYGQRLQGTGTFDFTNTVLMGSITI